MKTIGGYPSKNGEYNVNGEIVREIEQKELSKPDIKKILGDRQIDGFPTILIKNNKSFDEYNGSRDIDSLRQLFSKPKKSKKFSKNKNKRKRKTLRKRKSKRNRKTTRKPKPLSWLF
jgi:transposase